MKRNPLTDIMTPNPLTVTLDDSLAKVKDLMAKHDFRHLPVVSGEELVGIISQNDILRLSFGNHFAEQETGESTLLDLMSTEEVMTSNPVSIAVKCTVGEVAHLLVRANYHAVPVVEGTRLVGMVTTTDLIRYFLEQMGD